MTRLLPLLTAASLVACLYAFLPIGGAGAQGKAAAPDAEFNSAGFDSAWQRLRAGRTYEKQPTGFRTIRYPADGTSFEFHNLVQVPASYDPAR